MNSIFHIPKTIAHTTTIAVLMGTGSALLLSNVYDNKNMAFAAIPPLLFFMVKPPSKPPNIPLPFSQDLLRSDEGSNLGPRD
tara:strand:+ start:1978 stop:2223 length:246 start_codon:yes stop_codon:yes gene_type:complete